MLLLLLIMQNERSILLFEHFHLGPHDLDGTFQIALVPFQFLDLHL